MSQKTALITGASRGIGRAAAVTLAARGYHLMLTCRENTDLLEAVKDHITQHYPVTCTTFTGDMGDAKTVTAMYQKFKDRYTTLDIIVNNAGVAHIGLLTEMTPEQWDMLISTNLSSVFHICRLGIPLMLPRKSGKIVNISSVWGITGASCEAAYSAAKGGVNALTRALAKELAPSNIQVNAIACGAIDTDMNKWLLPEELEQLLLDIPAGRLGQPEEVAELIWDLCRGNNYLTGQVIQLDGGWI